MFKILNLKQISKRGFTLIELIVAMAILAIVTSGILANFINSQKKARDAQRKSDLKQIQNALEAYLNDYNTYPNASSGEISGASWGDEFSDAQGTIYMKVVPEDPSSDKNYCYVQTQSGRGYQLYTCLENDQDPDYNVYTGATIDCGSCAGGDCTYGVASSNESL